MRLLSNVGIGLPLLLVSTLVALADDVPVLDVQPICRGIAMQGGKPDRKGWTGFDIQRLHQERASRSRRVDEDLVDVRGARKGPLRSIGGTGRGTKLYRTDHLPGDGAGCQKTASGLRQRHELANAMTIACVINSYRQYK